MHGPFLFHMNALIYTLLGASDASSRFSAALFGVILVALPILLRGERHLGRWGALTASTLFLISPALLYQSRYIRHDIFTVVGSLVLFIAIMRYIERPSRGWLIAIGATLGFLLTNHEIVFGIAAIFFAVIAGALLWGRLRALAPLLLVSGVAAIALVALLPDAAGRPLPSIPWRSPTQNEQFVFYQDLLTHPLTIALVLLAIVTLAAAVLLVRRLRDPDRRDEGWAAVLFGDPPPGSVAAAARAAWLDRAGVSAALIAGLVIFAAALHHALHQSLRARLRHHRDRRHAPLLAGPARLPPRRAALVLLPAAHAAVRAHRRALWGRRDDRRRRAGAAGWDRPGDARTALRLPDVSCHLVHRHLPRALLGRGEDALAGHPHRAAGDAAGRGAARGGVGALATGRGRPSSLPFSPRVGRRTRSLSHRDGRGRVPSGWR